MRRSNFAFRLFVLFYLHFSLAAILAFPAQLSATDIVEELQYTLKWKGLTAGTAKLITRKIKHGRCFCLLYKSIAESTPAISRFYHVRDKVTSIFDPALKRTLASSKSLQEGGYLRSYSAKFDYSSRQISFEESKGKKNKSGLIKPIPGKLLDMLSSLHYARSLPLQVVSGKSHEMLAFDDLKIIHLKVEILKKSRIQIELNAKVQSLPAMLIRPVFSTSGIFRSKEPPLIWISDDKERIPLLIQTNVPLAGKIEARLTCNQCGSDVQVE